MQALPESKDAFNGPDVTEAAAKIYAAIGDNDRAINLISGLLQRPAALTVAALKLDPEWDPLRGDPRFEELIAKIAEDNGAIALAFCNRQLESCAVNSFFTELRRRKVYRAAAAYGVAGWFIIQFCATIFPAWEFPIWTLRLVIVLMLERISDRAASGLGV